MPIRGAVLNPTETQLAREKCEPLLNSVTDRLLRGGLAGFAEFRQRCGAECQRAMASLDKKDKTTASSSSTAPPTTNSTTGASSLSAPPAPSSKATQQRPPVARRTNPEGLKDVFAKSGVLFSPEEFRSILIAYSDAVGFVLAEDLLADLHPCRRAPVGLIHASTAAVAEGLFAELPLLDHGSGEGGASADFPAVTVDDVCDALSTVFDPALTPEEEEKLQDVEGPAVTAALTRLHADVQATFTGDVYTSGAVPAEDVVAFVVLAVQQNPAIATVAFSRLRNAPALSAAPLLQQQQQQQLPSSSSASLAASASRNAAGASGRTTAADRAALFSIRHTASSTQRKFEHYGDNVDRRDEWVRGRMEADARPMYMRHAVGYAGHLPEYQYRFGRTFHVIEEDLPQLTKPKPPLEPVAADWYGEGVELKDSRMNAHHYRLA